MAIVLDQISHDLKNITNLFLQCPNAILLILEEVPPSHLMLATLIAACCLYFTYTFLQSSFLSDPNTPPPPLHPTPPWPTPPSICFDLYPTGNFLLQLALYTLTLLPSSLLSTVV